MKDLSILPDEVVAAYLGFPQRNEFLPVGYGDGVVTVWVRGDAAQAQAAYEAMRAKDAARNDTAVDKVNRTLGAAFKWVGDLFKKHPEETKFVVDKVVDTALDANEYTKKGKEINDKINKGIKLAEDIQTMRAAIKDKDPASGLTMIKVGSDYTIGRIPVVGSAMSEVVVKAVETVETAPGGVKAMRNAGARADEAYRSGK